MNLFNADTKLKVVFWLALFIAGFSSAMYMIIRYILETLGVI